jgi:diguanylate cyclase (GGDEF)-like protein
MVDYYLMYIIVDVFLIIFTLIILFRLGSNIGSEYEIKVIRRMIYCYITAVAVDMVWALGTGSMIPAEGLVIGLANMVYWMAMSVGCYCWLLFIMARLHPTFVYGRWLKIVMITPIALCCFLDVASLKTGWIFSPLAGGTSDGPLFGVQSAIEYAYLILPALDALRCAIITHSKTQRKELLAYCFSMLIPLAAAVLDASLPMATPIGSMSIFVVILILFLMIQNSQINNDALTQLNNRRRMDGYLEDRIGDASEKQPLILFIMDVNKFKNINDTYGHVEGDDALKTVAAALKKAAERFNAFVARYGGDEFCLIVFGAKHGPEEVEAGMHQIMAAVQSAGGDKDYTLTLSIGYAVCTDPETAASTLIKRADEMLYKEKKAWYEGGR